MTKKNYRKEIGMTTYTMKKIDDNLWKKIKVLSSMNGHSNIQEYILAVMKQEVDRHEKSIGRSLLFTRSKTGVFGRKSGDLKKTVKN